MSPQFHTKVYTHLIIILFSAWLGYCIGHDASREVTNSGVQCAENERVALLQFKHNIRIDYCRLLDSWGEGLNCCQWHGIHCSNRSGHVIGLRLRGTDEDPDDSSYKACLEGTLSESLLELKHLKYLDLSLNKFSEQLPKFIGSLDALEHLNLSNAGFFGVVPQEIGNLSRLSSLDLNHEYGGSIMRVKNMRWLSHLRLLKQLDLSNVDLSAATNMWLPIVNSLPFLQVLCLDDCQLSLELPSSLSYINSSSTLNVVSLGGNKMNDTSIFKWLSLLKGLNTSLKYLDLSENQMFGNNVKVSGNAVQFLSSLCSLQTLRLSGTNLHYDLSSIVQSFSAYPHDALATLDLSWNHVWGSIPDNINSLSSLSLLDLSKNQLNGRISEALWGLSMLEILGLSFNSLKAVVTGEHLSNLSKLRKLSLGDNTEVVINISANWIPPFQLEALYLPSCNIGPHFPIWLTTQKHLISIDLSNTSISSRVPVSFFNSLSPKLQTLDMSQNMMHGVLPNVSITFDSPPHIDLSSNNFHGKLPPFLGNVSQLYLNNNNFSQGLVPFLCPHNKMSLKSLDLSSNLFSDKLPDCWKYFDKLVELNLKNNMLWGNLPTTIGVLDKLIILQMSNNNISGQLPSFLANCKSLVILDLSHNSLTRNIPSIFRDSFQNLSALMLSGNNFSGDLPSSFCQLSKIQILDFSNNLISGIIPKCIDNLRVMASTDNVFASTGNALETILNYHSFEYPYDGEVMMWKRKKSFFQAIYALGAVKSIDFSNNKLEGHIPLGISKLIGLMLLNLSRNHLSGTIPSKMGNLTSLETLDLSQNHLSGEIPSSLTEINHLGLLDLSYNNLSGRIPVGLQYLDLSSLSLNNNNLSQGLVPFLCPQNKMPLQYLDLSSNLFSDKLPNCWKYFDELIGLNLQNNMLWGNLPTTIGALDNLIILKLGNNNISGQLNSSLLSWKSLVILDISRNSLNGNIPSTIWDHFKNLSLLMLGSNNLSGDLPSTFCQLSQIQILDLSNNLISGIIPQCIYNLRGMANTDNELKTKLGDYDFGGEEMMWKGTESFFQGYITLGQAKTIDFSNNKLEGQIPEGISTLIGLMTLNLSRNYLSGAIPSKVGQLTSLETLDLSHNHLSGEIPSSLAKIDPLGKLDLSNNNLSGKIPTAPHLQTFDKSTYIGNPGLCGAPLPKCPGDEAATISQNGSNVTPHHEHHLDDFMLGLYSSVVLGFIMGFWGVCGTLVLKRSWRHAFFRFYDDKKDRIYVILAVHIARVWRRS